MMHYKNILIVFITTHENMFRNHLTKIKRKCYPKNVILKIIVVSFIVADMTPSYL